MNKTMLLVIIGSATLGLTACKKPAEQAAPANDAMTATNAVENAVPADAANATNNAAGNSAVITGEDNGQGGGTTRGPGQ